MSNVHHAKAARTPTKLAVLPTSRPTAEDVLRSSAKRVDELLILLIDIGGMADDQGDETDYHWRALRLARELQCDVEEAIGYCSSEVEIGDDLGAAGGE